MVIDDKHLCRYQLQLRVFCFSLYVNLSLEMLVLMKLVSTAFWNLLLYVNCNKKIDDSVDQNIILAISLGCRALNYRNVFLLFLYVMISIY